MHTFTYTKCMHTCVHKCIHGQELNSLAETIVARRDALVRAQEEFKAAMARAAAEEPKVNPWRS